MRSSDRWYVLRLQARRERTLRKRWRWHRLARERALLRREAIREEKDPLWLRGVPRPPKARTILDYYAQRARVAELHRPPHHYTIEIPPCFSLIDNPEVSLECIQTALAAFRSRSVHSCHFAQERCAQIDLEAEAVLQALALEAKRTRGKLAYSGSFPANEELRDIVLAAGLPRQLGLHGLPSPPGFMSFPLRKGRLAPAAARSSTHREVTADHMTAYIDDCFDLYGYRLTPDGLNWLSSLIGEVLGNAEEHGRHAWWVAAYLRQGSRYGDCHLTLFNFGPTIADTLRQLPPEALLRQDIERLCAVHARRRLFGREWTEDDLWTLYALQNGVSRLNDGIENVSDRGKGTVQLIRAFQEMSTYDGERRPRMCIVSGATQIRFDGRYKMEPMDLDGRPSWRIAFNDANDFERPPDRDAVRHLRCFFPGTIIGIRFFLDRRHLQRLTGGPAPLETIDLDKYRSPKVRVLAGRDRGQAVRREVQLDEKDMEPDVQVEIAVPSEIFSINSSFFLGLFGESVRALGEPGFRKKYLFSGPGLSDAIQRAIDEAIRDAIPTQSPLRQPKK